MVFFYCKKSKMGLNKYNLFLDNEVIKITFDGDRFFLVLLKVYSIFGGFLVGCRFW